MTQITIEDRVAALEKTVAQILNQPRVIDPVPIDAVDENAWESTIGIFQDDPLFDRIVEEGRRTRKSNGADNE